MNIEDLDYGLARLKYRVGLLEERAEAVTPTVKLKVAVRDTIAILQKWVKEKGTCLNEDNPDYCEVCSTLPMLEEAFNEYLKTDVRGRTKHGVTLDEANFRHTAEAEQDRLAMFGKAVSHEEAVRDKDNLDRVCDDLEAEQAACADDLVVISAWGGARTWMTACPSNLNEVSSQTVLWGKHKKDAKTLTRTEAAKLIAALTCLHSNAPPAFTVHPPHSEETKARLDLYGSVFRQPKEDEQTKMTAKLLKTFTLDKKPFTVTCARMTGLELKDLLPEDKRHYAIYVESSDMVADVGVGDNESIEVADKTLYSVPPAVFGAEAAKHKVTNLLGRAVEINVNSDKETLYMRAGEPLEISYERIVRIACDQIDKSKGRPVKPPGYDAFPMMSVTYRHKVTFDELPGEREGMLCKGQKVAVTPGMIINAYCT